MFRYNKCYLTRNLFGNHMMLLACAGFNQIPMNSTGFWPYLVVFYWIEFFPVKLKYLVVFSCEAEKQTILRQRTIRLSLLENKGQGLVLTRCVRKINFLAGDFMPRSCATLKSSAARPLFVFSHSHLSKHNWRNIPVARHNQILKSRNVEEGERVASERPLISFR